MYRARRAELAKIAQDFRSVIPLCCLHHTSMQWHVFSTGKPHSLYWLHTRRDCYLVWITNCTCASLLCDACSRGAVYDRLRGLQLKYACKEYQYAFPLMEQHCGYSNSTIPQAQDISDFLMVRCLPLSMVEICNDVIIETHRLSSPSCGWLAVLSWLSKWPCLPRVLFHSVHPTLIQASLHTGARSFSSSECVVLLCNPWQIFATS